MAQQAGGAGSGSGALGNQFGDTTYTKVFVGGLAWETQRETMRRHFEQFGEILEAVVITDKNTGRSKGYGFVTFRDADSAKRACADPTPVIDGRRANCNLASLGAHRHRPQHQHARTKFRRKHTRNRPGGVTSQSPETVWGSPRSTVSVNLESESLAIVSENPQSPSPACSDSENPLSPFLASSVLENLRFLSVAGSDLEEPQSPSLETVWGNPQSQSVWGYSQPLPVRGNPVSRTLCGYSQPQCVRGNPVPRTACGYPQPQRVRGNPVSQIVLGNPQPVREFSQPRLLGQFLLPQLVWAFRRVYVFQRPENVCEFPQPEPSSGDHLVNNEGPQQGGPGFSGAGSFPQTGSPYGHPAPQAFYPPYGGYPQYPQDYANYPQNLFQYGGPQYGPQMFGGPTALSPGSGPVYPYGSFTTQPLQGAPVYPGSQYAAFQTPHLYGPGGANLTTLPQAYGGAGTIPTSTPTADSEIGSLQLQALEHPSTLTPASATLPHLESLNISSASPSLSAGTVAGQVSPQQYAGPSGSQQAYSSGGGSEQQSG